MSALRSNEWREKARKVSRCMKGVSHEIRIGILLSLRPGEKTVTDLVKLLGAPQPTLSQHLSMMRDRGIVRCRKVGNQALYSVSDKRIYKMLDLIQELFCSAKGVQL